MVSIVMHEKSQLKQVAKALPKYIKQKCRFWASQDRMSLTSLARNIAAHEGDPVVVVCCEGGDEQITFSTMHALVGNMSGMTRCRIVPLVNDLDDIAEKVVMAVKELDEEEE
jgi:hypothetical protein